MNFETLDSQKSVDIFDLPELPETKKNQDIYHLKDGGWSRV